LAKEFGRTVIGVKMDLLQDAEIERVVGLAQETGIPLTSCSRPRVAIALAASAGLRCCRCSREDESRSAGVALRRSPPPIDATGSQGNGTASMSSAMLVGARAAHRTSATSQPCAILRRFAGRSRSSSVLPCEETKPTQASAVGGR
jgi:hypothetical protein